AKRCLAAEPEDRLADARVVAEAVTAYLAGGGERLHQAEVDRAAAQARAGGGGRTRPGAEEETTGERGGARGGGGAGRGRGGRRWPSARRSPRFSRSRLTGGPKTPTIAPRWLAARSKKQTRPRNRPRQRWFEACCGRWDMIKTVLSTPSN